MTLVLTLSPATFASSTRQSDEAPSLAELRRNCAKAVEEVKKSRVVIKDADKRIANLEAQVSNLEAQKANETLSRESAEREIANLNQQLANERAARAIEVERLDRYKTEVADLREEIKSLRGAATRNLIIGGALGLVIGGLIVAAATGGN